MPEPSTGTSYEHITGYWEWNIAESDSYINPVLKNSLGYAPDDFPDVIVEWKKHVLPADFNEFIITFNKHVESRGKIPFAQEIRFRHKNGAIIFILFTGKVVSFSSEGVPKQMFGSHINISAQKQTEKDLVKAQEFLKRTSQVANVGGWELDLVNKTVTWSDVTREIFGVDKNYLPGPGSSSAFFKPGDDRDKLMEAYHRAVELGEPYDLELKVIDALGREKWTRTVGQPEFENGYCTRLYGIFQDVTLKKVQEEALKQKQLQLETFIRNSPVALAMMDRELRYIAVSEIWMASYKLDISTLAGRSHFEVFPEIPDIWRTYLSRCLRGEVIRKEEDSFYRMDGRLEWLKWEVRPWYESPGVIGGIIMFTELVTDKVLNKQALVKAKEEAEQAAITKSRFLSVMSHEIRTPMNGVIGFTNLLLQNPRDDQRESLNVLKFSAQNLMAIINDVLDLNKIEEGKVVIEQVSFNLQELLNNICKSQEPDAREKDLKLSVQFEPTVPHWFRGDPMRIGQVITNLVSNAIKFTPAGKVNISTALVEDNGATMIIGFAVSDTGIGISEEKQEYIFEAFSQAELDTTRVYGGTGLGLAITKRLLHLMGTTIQLKSNPGKGSIFYFDLELATSVKPDKVEPVALEKSKPSLKGIKILITDDNPVNVLVVKRFLQQWQAEYDIAENGLIALEKIKSNNYDLVLMDLKMPVMDGYQATLEVRKLSGEKYRKLPIVALTASALNEMHDEILKHGMDAFVTKPFNPQVLFDTIKKLV